MAKKQEEESIKYSKYEIARMIGSRALQISSGAPILIKLSEEELKAINYSSLEIAKREFEQGLIPITVKRPFPDTTRKKEK